jgi:hypothetical protein
VHTAASVLKYNRRNDQSLDHDRAFLDAVRSGDPTAVRSPYPDAFKSLYLTDAATRSMASGEVIKL